MRHKTAAMTDRYTHLEEGYLERAIGALEANELETMEERDLNPHKPFEPDLILQYERHFHGGPVFYDFSVLHLCLLG